MKPESPQTPIIGTIWNNTVPARFMGARLENLDDDKTRRQLSAWCERIGDHLTNGNGLVFRGPVGTRKTTMAVAVAYRAYRHYVERLKMPGVIQGGETDPGKAVLFIRPYRLMDDLDKWRAFGDRDKFVEFEMRLRSAHLVILDDLGLEQPQSWSERRIHSIISDGYDQRRSVIVTMNALGPTSTYGKRIADRLTETCKFITLDGKSMRRPYSG